MIALAAPPLAIAPTGRWHGELVGGAPSGHLGNPGYHVPLLGNGYMGAVLSSAMNVSDPSDQNLTGTILDFWINSNANWDCEASGEALPPAHCSVRALGGLSLTVTGGPLAKNVTSLETEQRMAQGTLWTRRSDGTSTLETLSYIHSEQNVIVTDVTFSSTDPSASLPFETTLWTAGHNTHVRTSTEAVCVTNGTGGVAACSRRFHERGTTAYFAPWSAIAATLKGAPPPTKTSATTVVKPPFYNVSTVTQAYHLGVGTVNLVVALADNLIGGNEEDPNPIASSLALGASPQVVKANSQAFWSRYWNASSVSLPTRRTLEGMWYGAQYVTACMTASTSVHRKWKGRVPPPGLYGPFTTADYAFWNGDLTLDYNQEAPYYHVYSSNHPERAAAAFNAITDYAAAARAQAQRTAQQANLSCDASALNFPCHLAPWGYQSRDTRTYMQWNGPYAALLFINRWEYTYDEDFARQSTLPLLAGLNAWSRCYLVRRNASGVPGGYVLEDANTQVPDQIFENSPAVNPTDALALMRRVATAHRDIATALRESYPPYVDEIIAHLAPLPVVAAPSQNQSVWAAANGLGWLNSSRGVLQTSPLFPLWPSETIDGLSADNQTRAIAQATASLYANFSCGGAWPEGPPTCVYAGWGALTVFPALARALAGGVAGGAAVVGAHEMADAFEQYLEAYGANGTNFLAYAPGGGIENVGLAHPLNDMLVQTCSQGVIHLFPVWPLNEPASFTTLRVKGALLVSATWDPTARTARGVAVTATVDAPGRGRGGVALMSPWAEGVAVTLYCTQLGSSAAGEQVTSVKQRSVRPDAKGRLRWAMAKGEACRVEPHPAHFWHI